MEQSDFNEWLELRARLRIVKKREAELRSLVGKLVMGEARVGTEHAELYNHELKATIPLKYTVDADVKLVPGLTERQRSCIAWKPYLVVKDYKALNDDEREALEPYITSKPGSLSIEVSEMQS